MRPPQRNLGPGNDWGRWVEEQLQSLSTSATQAEQGNQRSFANNSAALKQLTNQLTTLEKQTAILDAQNNSFVTSQTLSYNGWGDELSFVGPTWANFAVVVSAAICNATTANERGNIRLIHSPAPITQFSEYNSTSLYAYGKTVSDFVGQRYPYVLSLDDSKLVYTRPAANSLGATSGTIDVTFVVTINWIS